MTAYTVTPEQKAAIAEKLIRDALWRIGGYTLYRRDEMCDWLRSHAEIVTTFLEGRTGAGSELPSADGKPRVGIEGTGADRRSNAGVPEPNDTPHSTIDAASALQSDRKRAERIARQIIAENEDQIITSELMSDHDRSVDRAAFHVACHQLINRLSAAGIIR